MLLHVTELRAQFFYHQQRRRCLFSMHKVINSHRMLPSICTRPSSDNRRTGGGDIIHNTGHMQTALSYYSHSLSPRHRGREVVK